MSELRPGNHDRAWNDPPVFAYSGPPKPDDSQPPKRNLLNKRVAFPMSGPSPSAPTAPTTLMPLLPTAGAPPPPTVFSVPGNPVVSEAKLEDVLDIFKGRLKENESKGDVFKRLQAMATSWEEGKLNQDICQRLKKMAELLTEGDTDAAESVRVSLAVDYSAECAGWIMAFKHIIHAGGD